ncbi:Conserved domain protein OS=Carboxydothermus hydrogenoformans (strain Z-2901 / DSM 6008) GN=CHY_0839 PE=4 SV=1 [Gemmataceae bacterium]|nr:Conserved domain protein OS=Carboxydothermus hydrogenoformans (strain Z-2901 / DSM 6008) GN=CHY_0839 PE=4 SV=1 [Gemmataceae bacterium]VTU02246.1 Conserved domain protein OS=Carboxydothermus hydrogenoformans (strain Z-2901 / DSM 6008) GN=CHY_0839 PE=4 SV=1 [Gemmataceae bacterium]
MKTARSTNRTESSAHGLTVAQQSAVDLLAAGKNDTETAAALNLSRVTVTRWRLYSPEFRAALTDRRAAVWGAAADRLRTLLPRALDTLADALERGDDKVNVALAVLKLAGPLPLVPTGPTDPEDIVRDAVQQERDRIRTNRDNAVDRLNGLPDYDSHAKAVRKRLAQLAPPDDGRSELA